MQASRSFQHVLLAASPVSMAIVLITALAMSACGGRAPYTTPPIILSVSLGNDTVTIVQGGAPVYVPVMIQAPTETATFAVTGLPPA